MISGVGGFSVYPPLQGGYSSSQQGTVADESLKEKTNAEKPQIIGSEFGKSEAPLLNQTQQSDTYSNLAQNSSSTTQDPNSSENKEKEKQNLSEDEKAPSGEELTEEEKKQVQELKERDAEVRAHEQAHLAAAGSLSQGGASFEYQKGPDGGSYAIGGEVSIDTSKVAGDPAATIEKAQRIRRAAQAPAEPSSTDRAVAASASAMEAEARKELAAENQKELKTEGAETSSVSGTASATGTSPTNSSSSITDFYKNIQGTSAASQGVSQLDIFA